MTTPDSALSVPVNRRRFLGVLAASTGAIAAGRILMSSDFAFANVSSGSGPYGSLLAADANGILLPPGFTSRVVARSGQTVANSSYVWHGAPDGGACFPAANGEWVYASNSELGSSTGGVGVISFASSGAVAGGYRILSGTTRNCAGGPTPWGTWLSCEENGSAGKVYECNPLASSQGVVRNAMGSFNHEAAVVDPVTGQVYLTEDDPSGRLYRFTPSTPNNLSAGTLEAARVSGTAVTWVATSASGPDRQSTTTAFNGGEGAWVHGRSMFFTTKGNNRVYELQLDSQQLTILYDAATTANAPLTGVDNITAHPSSGDLFVAEDGGNMELCIIAWVGGVRQVAPFLRISGQSGSEITGPAFSPDGTRMYLSSQRGTSGFEQRWNHLRDHRPVPPRLVPTPADHHHDHHDSGGDHHDYDAGTPNDCDAGGGRLDVAVSRQRQQPGHRVAGVRVQRRRVEVRPGPARLRRSGHHRGQLRVEFEPQVHHHVLPPGIHRRERLHLDDAAPAAR